MTSVNVPKSTKLHMSFKSVVAILSIPEYLVRALLYSAGLLFVLQWLFNIQILWSIIVTTPVEVPRVLIEGYLNLFRFGFDLTPVTLVLIAVFQGVSFAVLRFIRQAQRKKKRQNYGTLGMALLGSGCVACGGSVIAPLIGLFTSGSSVVLSQAISDVILVVAAALALYSVYTLGVVAAHVLQQK